MEDEVSKGKDKRACVDCHFLAEVQYFSVPDDLDAIPPRLNCFTTEHLEVHHVSRKQFRKKDYSRYKSIGSLECHLECWKEKSVRADQKFVEVRHEVIVETDRSDSCFFYDYSPGMSFRTAKVLEERNASPKRHETTPIETTLSYYKTTGKFGYGNNESIPISPTPRHKVRDMAEKLMKWWEKGKPCPQSEVVRDTKKKTPRRVYDNTVKIRKTLRKYLEVNMPQCANDEYTPPKEPKHFKIVS